MIYFAFHDNTSNHWGPVVTLEPDQRLPFGKRSQPLAIPPEIFSLPHEQQAAEYLKLLKERKSQIMAWAAKLRPAYNETYCTLGDGGHFLKIAASVLERARPGSCGGLHATNTRPVYQNPMIGLPGYKGA